jgi:hypothetical protein
MRRQVLLAGWALILGTGAPALGQTVSPDGAVLTYDPGYFSAYSPANALDMVEEVPGFAIDNGASVRGLADTFANVLVDGERQNTKSESIHEILRRIPAGQVERVELVREAVAGIDMRGQSRVVNVVLNGRDARTTTIGASIHYFAGTDQLAPGIEVSTRWDAGRTRLVLGGGVAQRAAPQLRTAWLEDAGGQLIERRDERMTQHRLSPSANAGLRHRFEDGGRLNLTLTAGQSSNRLSDRVRVEDAAGQPRRVELFGAETESAHKEATLTFERHLADTVSGRIVLLHRDATSDASERFLHAPQAGQASTSWYERAVSSGERAMRGNVSWDISERHVLDLGAEAAVNFRDNALAISQDTGAGPVDIDLPVANTRVEEQRSELFASHLWKMADRLTLESGFRIERSSIQQTGDAARERAFTYPKPSVRLTWTVSEQTQWEFLVEREVAQLSFDEFASAVNPREDQTLLGNPELVPQKTWRGRARWEGRWGEAGTIAVSLTHERVEDLQDSRPVTLVSDASTMPAMTTTFDAPGNIGEGERTYLLVDTSLPLDGVGLGDARLNLSGMLRHSTVTDPTTGEERRFPGNEDWRLSADFRQNLPAHALSWGWRARVQGDEDRFRHADSYLYDRSDPEMSVFVESTAIHGVTVNLEYGDFTSAVERRTRTYHDGGRERGVVRAREVRDRDEGGYVSLWVRATL